jgi:5-deoxy-glucuronate isomerase
MLATLRLPDTDVSCASGGSTVAIVSLRVDGPNLTTLLEPGPGHRLGCVRSLGELDIDTGADAAWLLIESGLGSVTLDGECHTAGGRADVFEGVGWSALLAPGTTARVDGDVRCALVWRTFLDGDDDSRAPTGVIDPGAVADEVRGDGPTQRRVRTYASDGSLSVGETLNPPGGWSSWPPHSHAHEEIYLYRFAPTHGFGVHVDLAGQTAVVRDGDIKRITTGEHPVVAAPGFEMYYLWALAGESPLVETQVAEQWRRET